MKVKVFKIEQLRLIMVTVAEQLQQVGRAEAQIRAREGELSEQERKAQQIRAKRLDISRQLELQRTGQLRAFQQAGGLAGERERKREQRVARLSQIQTARQQLVPTRQQLASAKTELETERDAQAIINRMIQGKRTTLGQESAAVKQRVRELGNVPEIQAAIQRGTEAKLAAMEAGFDDVSEFQAVSGFFEKKVFKDSVSRIIGTKGEGVVSESVFKELKEKAVTGTGAEKAQAREAISKVGSFIPQREISARQIEIETGLPVSRETLKPIGTLEAIPEPESFLQKTERFVERKRAEVETERAKGRFSPQQAGLSLAAGAVASVAGTARFFKQAVTEPGETFRGIGTGLKAEAVGFLEGTGSPSLSRAFETAVREPEFATGFVGGELLQAKVGGSIISGTGRFTEVVSTRFSPTFRRIERVGDVDIIKGIPSTVDKTAEIRLAGTLGSKTAPLEPLSKQIRLAGQNVDAVSAARDLFGTIRRRRITVDKPLPTPDSPPLERAFFADPRGRLRVSRLGVDDLDRAGFADIFAGDVTFRRPRPQALFFENVPVQKLPKRLASIQRKIQRGQTLTAAEEAALLKFQLTPSGQFKPLGFLSREPEIVLAPGEIIRRQKSLGVTLVRGRRVEIIRPEIIQARGTTRSLILQEGLTPGELSKLRGRLRRETGLSLDASGRFISPSRISAQSAILGGPLISRRNQTISRVNILPRRLSARIIPRRRSPVSILPSRPRRFDISRRGASPLFSPRQALPTSLSRVGPISRGTSILQPTSPIRRPEIIPKIVPGPTPDAPRKKRRRRERGFRVFGKRRGVFRELARGPVTRREALAIGTRFGTETLGRTFKIVGTSARVQQRIRTSLSQRDLSQFRRFRIRRGRKAFEEGLFIQRRGFTLGTKGERAEILKARRIL